MKKPNDNGRVDESSEESFPASDPPSWAASPPGADTVSVPLRDERSVRMDLTDESDAPEASTARAIERLAARVPEDVLLWTGLGAAAASLGLALAGKGKVAVSILGWVPALLAFELYAKQARSAAGRSYRPDLH